MRSRADEPPDVRVGFARRLAFFSRVFEVHLPEPLGDRARVPDQASLGGCSVARASRSSSPRDASSAPSNAGPRKGGGGVDLAAAVASSAASEPDVASADVIASTVSPHAKYRDLVRRVDTADRSRSLRGPNRARLARAAIRPRVLRAPRSGSHREGAPTLFDLF